MLACTEQLINLDTLNYMYLLHAKMSLIFFLLSSIGEVIAHVVIADLLRFPSVTVRFDHLQ